MIGVQCRRCPRAFGCVVERWQLPHRLKCLCAQTLLSNEGAFRKEYLTKNMADLASRATIINFINDEISKGSLTTQVSTKDKRVKIIQPSSELIDEFTMWLDMIYKAA